MRRLLVVALTLAAIVVSLLWAGGRGIGPIVITREDEFKLLLRLGNPVLPVLDAPGLSLRVPLLDEVRVFDKRLQYLNAQPVEMLIADSEKLIIDYYSVWRISDPLAFLRNYPGDIPQARSRIQDTVNSLVGARIGALDLSELLRRGGALSNFDEESTADLRTTGVEIVDVRLNRIELPRAAEPAAYSQMREQRLALAREYRAIGERRARELRAGAERKARLRIAEAQAKAEQIRAEADAESARVYASSYGRNPEFYAFYRSLETYRSGLGAGTTLVLPPDHALFRFLDPGVQELADIPTPTLRPLSKPPAPGAAGPTPAPASTPAPVTTPAVELPGAP